MTTLICSGNAATSGNIYRAGAPRDSKNPKSGIAVYSQNNALGNVSVYIDPYVVEWKRTEHKLPCGSIHYVSYATTRKVSFSDEYIFNNVERLKQVATDYIPSIIAGDGVPYFITGETTDTIHGVVVIECK